MLVKGILATEMARCCYDRIFNRSSPVDLDSIERLIFNAGMSKLQSLVHCITTNVLMAPGCWLHPFESDAAASIFGCSIRSSLP